MPHPDGLSAHPISTRPQAFWSMIVNEGELNEKFGIKTIPITLADINWRMLKVLKEKGQDYEDTLAIVRNKMKQKLKANSWMI